MMPTTKVLNSLVILLDRYRFGALPFLFFALAGALQLQAATTINCVPATGPVEHTVPYSTTCTATGGTGPYTWSIVPPDGLPAGIILTTTGPATATVSGTPTGNGSYSFTVRAVDTLASAGTQVISGFVVPIPAFTCTNNAAPVEVGVAYTTTCTVTALTGTAPYNWTISAGALPAGLTLSPSIGGSTTISGTPTAFGATSYSLRVSDNLGVNSNPQTFSGTIAPLLSISCVPSGSPNEVGAAYSALCTASGGVAPFTWSISAGALPAGFVLTPSGTTATVSGTPTTVAPFSYTVRVSDSAGPPKNADQAFTGSIAPPVSASCSAAGTLEVGVVYTVSCSVSGGVAPFTWASTSPVPGGLSVNSSTGAVTGSFTTPGAFDFKMRVTDSASTPRTSDSGSFTGSVIPAPSVSCTPSTGPVKVGNPYSSTCTVSNGTAPFNWSVTLGSLPLGLTLSTTAGTSVIIFGTPSVAGAYNYTIQVADSATTIKSATQSFSGTILPGLSMSCTPSGGPTEVGVSYSSTCTSLNGNGANTWSIEGTLPAGLTLSTTTGASVTVSGVPTASVASFIYSVRVSDSSVPVQNSTQTFVGSIAAAPTVTCLPNTGPIQQGISYSSTCTVSGGTAPYTWSITGGGLPIGITLAPPTGASTTISGTPTGSGDYTYTVRVLDSATNSAGGAASQPATAVFSGTVRARPVLSCLPASGPTEVGVAFSSPCTVTGGTAPYNWTTILGARPDGVNLVPAGASATVAGSPTSAGSYDFTIQVTDGLTATTTQRFIGTIVPLPTVSCTTITPGPPIALGPFSVEKAYSANCTVSGGTSPYNWSLASGAFPAGINYVSPTGSTVTVSGTPTAVGAFNYTLQVTDSAVTTTPVSVPAPQFATSILYSGSVASTLAITCAPLTGPTQVGVAYSTTCTATGGTSPYNWLISTGSLPPGITPSAPTGGTFTISGTPTAAGSFSYTVQLTDSAAVSIVKSQAFTANIVGQPTVSCSTLSAGSPGPYSVERSYSLSCTAAGGTPPYTWNAESTGLPPGITFETTAGNTVLVSGTPVSPGAYSFRLRATDSAVTPLGAPDPKSAISGLYSGTIAATLIISCLPTSGPTQVGVPYSARCDATGGTQPYNWTISAGALPSGITLIPTTGSPVNLSGTPTAVGSFAYTVLMTDSSPVTISKTQSFAGTIVGEPTVSCSTTSEGNTKTISPFSVEKAYRAECTVANGTPPYTWTVRGSGLPGGLSLDPSNGVGAKVLVVGTPQPRLQPFSYSLRVTDSAPQPKTADSPPYEGTIADVLAVPDCKATLGSVQVGMSYSSKCTTTGGTPPYTWKAEPLPPGLRADSAGNTLTISGTPTASGDLSYKVTLTDDAPAPIVKSFQAFGTILARLTMSCSPQIGPRMVGLDFSAQCTVQGGTDAIDWVVEKLPTGLQYVKSEFPARSLTVTGAPLSPDENYSFTFSATDSAKDDTGKRLPQHATYTYTGSIKQKLSITCNTEAGPAEIKVAYVNRCTAAGGTPPYVWNVTGLRLSGSPPLPINDEGDSLNAFNFTFTPSEAGVYDFQIAVSDRTEPTQTEKKRFIGTVVGQPVISCNGGQAGPADLGIDYSNKCSVAGGRSPFRWSIESTQPSWVKVTSDTEVTIAGKPEKPGDYSFTLTLVDSVGGLAQAFNIRGNVKPALITSAVPLGTFVRDGITPLKIEVNNTSLADVAGRITVRAELPAGISLPTKLDDENWSCVSTNSAVTCTLKGEPARAPKGVQPLINLDLRVSNEACSASTNQSINIFVKQDDIQHGDARVIPVNVTGCLLITKTHDQSFDASRLGVYTITVKNATAVSDQGPEVSIGKPIVVKNLLHESLEVDPSYTANLTNGWDCDVSRSSPGGQQLLTCTYMRGIAIGDRTDPKPITLSVRVNKESCGLISDIASVLLRDVLQAEIKDPTSISGTGCLQISGIFKLPDASLGTLALQNAGAPGRGADSSVVHGIYTFKVNNISEAEITDDVEVEIKLPQGVEADPPTNAEWQCDLSGPIRCRRVGRITPGSHVAKLEIPIKSSLPCGVALDGTAVLRIKGKDQGGPAKLVIPMRGNDCLFIERSTKLEVLGAVAVGEYKLSVSNPGAKVKVGPLTVTETLPRGLRLVGLPNGGSSWKCAPNANADGDGFICVRQEGLAAEQRAEPILVTVRGTYAACPGVTSTALLEASGTRESADSAEISITDCFRIEDTTAVATGSDTLRVGGPTKLSYLPVYRGDQALSGMLIFDQVLTGDIAFGAVPVSNGVPTEWNCSTSESNRRLTCTRAAAGTYRPIEVDVVVGIQACGDRTTETKSQLNLDRIEQITSSARYSGDGVDCPRGKLTMTADSPNGAIFVEDSQVFRINVSSPTDAATGKIVVIGSFLPGISYKGVTGGSAIWTCVSEAGGQKVQCTSSQESLEPGKGLDTLHISAIATGVACPSVSANFELRFSGKSSGSATVLTLMRGCITHSPQVLNAGLTLSDTAKATGTVDINVTDSQPLELIIKQMPRGSSFKLNRPDGVASWPADTYWKKIVSGERVIVNVDYEPSCIGQQSESLVYAFRKDNESEEAAFAARSRSVSLEGIARLSGLRYRARESSATLFEPLGSSVAPDRQLILDLDATPGFCRTGVTPGVTWRIANPPKFTRAGNRDRGVDVTYDAKLDDSTGKTLYTGTVAGQITLLPQFTLGGRAITFSDTEMRPLIGSVLVSDQAPVLKGVSLKGTPTGSSFSLEVQGYSTPRQDTEVCFRFTAAPGAVLDSKLSACYGKTEIDNWYDRLLSRVTGSQFNSQISFTFSFTGADTAIGTIETWIKNSVGNVARESNKLCYDFKGRSTKDGACQ